MWIGLHEAVSDELVSTNKTLEESNLKHASMHPSTTKFDHVSTLGKASQDHMGLRYTECSTSMFAPSTTTFVCAKIQLLLI